MGLPDFEGRPVIQAAMRITKVGDGLSEALKLAPVALHHDDEVFLVLKARVTQVNHKPIAAEEEHLTRVHTVEGIETAIVTEADVADLLAVAGERVVQAKEEARRAEEREAGILDLDDAGLLEEHEAGNHADLVEGCPECDAERDAEAAESKGKRKAKTRLVDAEIF